MSLKCIYLVHSPKVKKIEVVGRGSGCFKSNLKDRWIKLKKMQLSNPKIKKRVMKSRGFKSKKKVVEKKPNNFSVKYDQIVTDSVKRLL